MDTGKLIRATRREHKMSQERLAHLLNVTEKTVRRWERGEHDVPARVVLRIAEIFDVPVEVLFPESEAVA